MDDGALLESKKFYCKVPMVDSIKEKDKVWRSKLDCLQGYDLSDI